MLKMSHIEADMFLRKVYTSLSRNFELQLINSYQVLSSEHVDNLVEMEMKHLKMNYISEEDRYVKEMLLENPIVVERRMASITAVAAKRLEPTRNQQEEEEQQQQQQNRLALMQQQQHQQQQQQRAESCRKSRINNKVKKAKTKYRHKYVSRKLTQSANMLQCLRDVIAQTERQLLCCGYNQTTLENLKLTYGIRKFEGLFDFALVQY